MAEVGVSWKCLVLVQELMLEKLRQVHLLLELVLNMELQLDMAFLKSMQEMFLVQ